jgi:hypothetical protein
MLKLGVSWTPGTSKAQHITIVPVRFAQVKHGNWHFSTFCEDLARMLASAAKSISWAQSKKNRKNEAFLT